MLGVWREALIEEHVAEHRRSKRQHTLKAGTICFLHKELCTSDAWMCVYFVMFWNSYGFYEQVCATPPKLLLNIFFCCVLEISELVMRTKFFK